MTLATCIAGDVWSAPVAYAIGGDGKLYFYSATESVHLRHIMRNPKIAGSAFNSTAEDTDVDGLQFGARCTVVNGPDLEVVTNHYFRYFFPDEKAHAWWYRSPDSFQSAGVWRFCRITLESAYVIDQETFPVTKVDRRVAVDLELLNDRLMGGSGVKWLK